MATVAIGDIHGNSSALESLLSQVVPEMRSEDRMVFLGDYIDRGPDSRGCIERILRLREEGCFQVVTLMGNHEQWMLRTLDDFTQHSWLVGMEALDTVRSYSPEAAKELGVALDEHGARLFTYRMPLPYESFFDAMPLEHVEFFQRLEPFHHSPDVLCVHGGADLEGNLDPLDLNTFVWGPYGFPEDYKGAAPVVYGHRHNAIVEEEGAVHPCIGSNQTYGIDSIENGVLTAMRFPDKRIFQSLQSRSE
jgi:serine/threonine protein phosphatase 1